MAASIRSALVFAAAAAALAAPSRAHADGAFPNAMALFVPGDQPQVIIETTNFGLVISHDGGVTWQLVCEQAVSATSLVTQYQLGPPPGHILFAVAGEGGMIRSIDGGCTWQHVVDGADLRVRDVYPDPIDADHVFLIGRAATTTTATTADALFESRDGGASFYPVFYAAPTASLLSVEIARSTPRPVYVTLALDRTKRPTIGTSTDAASHFTLHEQTSVLGESLARIALVDPEDPQVLYIRVSPLDARMGEALAISRDGGRTVEISKQLIGKMNAFLRGSDGTLLISETSDSLVSTDGGRTWEIWPLDNIRPPHVRWFGERDGTIYVSADNSADKYAVGKTTDDGKTFTPLLSYCDIQGPMQCGELPATCSVPWQTLKCTLGCDCGSPPPPPPPPAKTDDSCSCTTASAPSSEPAWMFLAGVLLLVVLRRGRLFLPLVLFTVSTAEAQNPSRGNTVTDLLTPAGVGEIADDHYLVTWHDGDGDSASPSATVELFYTATSIAPFKPGTVPDALDGKRIAPPLSVNDALNMKEWETSSVAPGAYLLWSRTYDPESSRPLAMISFAPGAVVVAHPGDPVSPAAVLSAPANPFVWPPADAIDLEYQSFDPDGSGSVRLEAAPRAKLGELFLIADHLPASQSGKYTWDTRAIAEGDYALRITITDGRGLSFTAWDRFFRTVNHAETAGGGGCSCDATRRTGGAMTVTLAFGIALSLLFAVRRRRTRARSHDPD